MFQEQNLEKWWGLKPRATSGCAPWQRDTWGLAPSVWPHPSFGSQAALSLCGLVQKDCQVHRDWRALWQVAFLRWPMPEVLRRHPLSTSWCPYQLPALHLSTAALEASVPPLYAWSLGIGAALGVPGACCPSPSASWRCCERPRHFSMAVRMVWLVWRDFDIFLRSWKIGRSSPMFEKWPDSAGWHHRRNFSQCFPGTSAIQKFEQTAVEDPTHEGHRKVRCQAAGDDLQELCPWRSPLWWIRWPIPQALGFPSEDLWNRQILAVDPWRTQRGVCGVGIQAWCSTTPDPMESTPTSPWHFGVLHPRNCLADRLQQPDLIFKKQPTKSCRRFWCAVLRWQPPGRWPFIPTQRAGLAALSPWASSRLTWGSLLWVEGLQVALSLPAFGPTPCFVELCFGDWKRRSSSTCAAGSSYAGPDIDCWVQQEKKGCTACAALCTTMSESTWLWCAAMNGAAVTAPAQPTLEGLQVALSLPAFGPTPCFVELCFGDWKRRSSSTCAAGSSYAGPDIDCWVQQEKKGCTACAALCTTMSEST